MEQFFQQLLNGLAVGGIYALVALGYTMVYGVLKLINFAHGDLFTIGAYLGLTLLVSCNLSGMLPLPVAVLAVFVMVALLVALIGFLLERAAYRPLRDAPRISALISAIAVSFFIESLAVVVFTGQPRPVLQPEWLVSEWQVGGLRILRLTAFVPAMTAVLVGILLYIVYRTKPGLAMRAISKDIETTRLLGVRVDNIIAFTFCMGSALAAASGIMWALRYPQVHPYMGIMPGLKAFIAAVFGGIGSIPGAVVGAFLIGLCEEIIKGLGQSTFSDAFTFALLIIVLCVKPTGLFGEKVTDKV